MLLQHIGWLGRFLLNTLVLLLSAFLAVDAQTSWDAAAARGPDAQFHALLEALEQPLSFGTGLGLGILGLRVGIDLWLGGIKRRRQAAKKLQKTTVGRVNTTATTVLVKLSAPAWVGISLFAIPMAVWMMFASSYTPSRQLPLNLSCCQIVQ